MSNYGSNHLKPDNSDRPPSPPPTRSLISSLMEFVSQYNISKPQLLVGLAIILLLIILLVIITVTPSSESINDAKANPNTMTLPVSPLATTAGTHFEEVAIAPTTIKDADNSFAANATEIVIEPAPESTIETPNISPLPENTHRANEQVTTVEQYKTNRGVTDHSSTPLHKTKTSTATITTTQQTVTGKNKGLPKGKFTLQLSGALQDKTLEQFANSHQLSPYWIYETQNSGKPWFVLVYGSFESRSAAQKAIMTLPSDVQAKKPWIKPVELVRKEAH